MFATLEEKLIGAGVVLLAIMLVITAFLWERGDKIKAEAERDSAKAQVSQALLANGQLAKANDNAKAMADDNSKLGAEFAQSVQAIQAHTDQTRTQLVMLGQTDAKAKDFLATPVPDSVQRLLASPTVASNSAAQGQR